jgi:hypothetical protein
MVVQAEIRGPHGIVRKVLGFWDAEHPNGKHDIRVKYEPMCGNDSKNAWIGQFRVPPPKKAEESKPAAPVKDRLVFQGVTPELALRYMTQDKETGTLRILVRRGDLFYAVSDMWSLGPHSKEGYFTAMVRWRQGSTNHHESMKLSDLFYCGA